MIIPDYPNRRKGHYLGTEIDEKWWKRYRKDKMFARGNGEYWFDDATLYFRRYLTKHPIQIQLAKVFQVKIGKSHAVSIVVLHRIYNPIQLRRQQTFLRIQHLDDICAHKPLSEYHN